jgi:hypothetical protein
MEIAHAQTGVLRVIGKIVLLGLLIIVLAKVIFAVLALAVVGLLAYFCARFLYVRRARFARFLCLAIQGLIQSVQVLSQIGTTVAKAAVCSLSWMALRWTKFACTKVASNLARLGVFMAETLRTATVLICKVLVRAATIGCAVTCKSVQKAQRVIISALLISFCCGKKTSGAFVRASVRGGSSLMRVLGTALVKTRDQSSVILGTMVETASGALIGAMLALISSYLAHEDPIQARVCGAALFGAFLGITVGLSRTTWAKDSEASQFIETEN